MGPAGDISTGSHVWLPSQFDLAKGVGMVCARCPFLVQSNNLRSQIATCKTHMNITKPPDKVPCSVSSKVSGSAA